MIIFHIDIYMKNYFLKHYECLVTFDQFNASMLNKSINQSLQNFAGLFKLCEKVMWSI